MRYATLQELNDHCQLGASCVTRVIDGVSFERLEGRDYDDNEIFGWIAHHLDAKGDVCDWDRVDPQEAVELKLVKKSQVKGAI